MFRGMLRTSTKVLSASCLAGCDAVQVSHMAERCILVDTFDNIVGESSKKDAHHISSMQLHRAFSVFAFTPDRRLILQKRSSCKVVFNGTPCITFPDLWTNTCCSHPLHNEHEMDGELGIRRAAVRKLKHELGIEGIDESHLTVHGRFLYKATMQDSLWGEHELDYAVVLRNFPLSSVFPNPEEVSHVKAVEMDELKKWVGEEPFGFSPWFKLFVEHGYLWTWWKSLDNLSTPADLPIIHLN